MTHQVGGLALVQGELNVLDRLVDVARLSFIVTCQEEEERSRRIALHRRLDVRACLRHHNRHVRKGARNEQIIRQQDRTRHRSFWISKVKIM